MQITAASPAPAAPEPWQPRARVQVAIDPTALFAGNRRIAVEFEAGKPTAFATGDGFKPIDQASPQDRVRIDIALQAAAAVSGDGFPNFHTRDYRGTFDNDLRNGDFELTLLHWPGAPTSKHYVAGNVRDLGSDAPRGVADAVAALQQMR